MHYLGIDAGNTRTKFYKLSLGDEEPSEIAPTQIKWNAIQGAVIVRTGKLPDEVKQQLEKHSVPVLEIHSGIRLPFTNLYQSASLGADRIALIAGATELYGGNVLVIDAGSCITYDFLDDRQQYRGGAISPGIGMRYKALHDYTSDLPLLPFAPGPPPLTGKTTSEAIHSGVINGVIHEIKGFIERYREISPSVKVTLTGGDAEFLSESLKIKIFAIHKNLLARGMQVLLRLNKEDFKL